MNREATWTECYQAMYESHIGWFTSFVMATILWMRKTKVMYDE